MYWEQWIIVLSTAGAAIFGFRAAMVRRNRWWVGVPAFTLFLIAAYELFASRWEKTVSAPIRMDMFVEIPLMILFLIWGVAAILLSGKKKSNSPQSA
jgi:hypothetical protein